MIATTPGEPTFDETQRIMLRINSAGTVSRLDRLHSVLLEAYRNGYRDGQRDCARRHGHEA